MTKPKISEKLINYLIEAVMIFSSVFLAFWLTEVRETKKANQLLEVSLQHIASEMEYNHKRIESIFEYYVKMINAIDSLKKNSDINPENHYGYELNGWNGVQIPMLRSTAYQTFLNSGTIDNADFDMAKSFAGIYSVQSVIERLENSFYDIAATDNAFTSLSKVRHLFGIYAQILPDVLTGYQIQGKKWLADYGYNLDISNEKLKEIVTSRMPDMVE